MCGRAQRATVDNESAFWSGTVAALCARRGAPSGVEARAVGSLRPAPKEVWATRNRLRAGWFRERAFARAASAITSLPPLTMRRRGGSKFSPACLLRSVGVFKPTPRMDQRAGRLGVRAEESWMGRVRGNADGGAREMGVRHHICRDGAEEIMGFAARAEGRRPVLVKKSKQKYN